MTGRTCWHPCVRHAVREDRLAGFDSTPIPLDLLRLRRLAGVVRRETLDLFVGEAAAQAPHVLESRWIAAAMASEAVQLGNEVGFCLAAKLGKLGDTELPVTPWQLEHTCSAITEAETAGFATSRDRSGLAQPTDTTAAAAAKTRVADFMSISRQAPAARAAISTPATCRGKACCCPVRCDRNRRSSSRNR